MGERKVSFGIEVEPLQYGHSFGICLTHSTWNQERELYLYINLVFWTMSVGWFARNA